MPDLLIGEITSILFLKTTPKPVEPKIGIFLKLFNNFKNNNNNKLNK